MTVKKIKLSASKIKSLETCSYIYYCQYVLKIPQTTNLGASRGLCAHIVLECFVNPRHFKHYKTSLEKSEVTPAVRRLILKHAKKLNITENVDLEMVEDMVCVAARYDFFTNGAEKVVAEREFKIESEHYIINGFIDKMSFLNKSVKITDYKTSKAKFNKEEMESNIQALMYSLACFKENKIIPEVEFVFLRFPKNPLQFFKKCTERQLKGFELYLESIAKYLLKFDERKAQSNLAANTDKRWLCGKEGLKNDGSKAFICQYRNPLDYYVIKNKEGEIIKSSFKKDLTTKEGEKLQKMRHTGCPAFKENPFGKTDPFDFL